MDPEQDQELVRIASLPIEERAAELSRIIDGLEGELEETAHPEDEQASS